MIYYVVHKEDETLMLFPADWGRKLAPHMRFCRYRSLLSAGRIPVGAYIFTDFDRISAGDREKVARCWSAIQEANPDIPLLNHPLRVKRRFELLRTLYEEGINDFNVYRVKEVRRPERFPVFLRIADDHSGPRTGLLHDQAELDAEIERLTAEGVDLDGWIITEYCAEPGPDGAYRKYGAFKIGPKLLARHIFFSSDWLNKHQYIVSNADTVREELAFVETNPHREQLERIFDLANIDYGRIDYTIVNGRIQVFEINTNPTAVPPGTGKTPERLKIKEAFARPFEQALLDLDIASDVGPRNVEVRHPKTKWSRPPISHMALRTTRALRLGRFDPLVYNAIIGTKQSFQKLFSRRAGS